MVLGLLALALGALFWLFHVLIRTVTPGLFENTKGFVDLKAPVESLEDRVGSLEEKVSAHDRRFDTLEEQGRTLADAIYELSSQFREHLRRHAS